ncbi:hypothetical protein ACP6NF_03330 [Alcaligenes faecalis]|uniref:hypothetical protein n=1 Tax=Alcaligenes faecalis TaxID=511 RepID=UPI003F7C3077
MGIKWKEDYSARTQRYWGVALGLMAGFAVGVPVGWGGASFPNDASFVLAFFTAIGTVGAVVVTLGQSWYRKRQERTKSSVAARLAAPVIVSKLIDRRVQTQRLCLAHQEVAADLAANTESRVSLANWAAELQRGLTVSEVTIVADFALEAAKAVSIGNGHLEHFRLYLMQPSPVGGSYSPNLIFDALDEMTLAHRAFAAAVEEMDGWSDWH